MLVIFFCTLFVFICSIKCTAGGAAAHRRCILCCRQLAKVCRKVNKHINMGCNVSIVTVERQRVNVRVTAARQCGLAVTWLASSLTSQVRPLDRTSDSAPVQHVKSSSET